jgi:hypothetical protein
MDVADTPRTQEQYDPSTVFSPTSLQSSEEDERRGKRMLEKRAIRRSFYDYFLAKFIYTVKEGDLVEEKTEASGTKDEEDSTTTIVFKCNDKRRVADGTCSICFEDYKAGDRIVCSPLEECQHVFCYDSCMMGWLEKGKKRCPICRHWFVPATSIRDQIYAEFGEDNAAAAEDDDLDRDEFNREISV